MTTTLKEQQEALQELRQRAYHLLSRSSLVARALDPESGASDYSRETIPLPRCVMDYHQSIIADVFETISGVESNLDQIAKALFDCDGALMEQLVDNPVILPEDRPAKGGQEGGGTHDRAAQRALSDGPLSAYRDDRVVRRAGEEAKDGN